MSVIKNVFLCLSLISIMALGSGCAEKYAYKPSPVKDVSAYQNAKSVLGVQVGAEAIYDASDLKKVYGFNLKSAGVVPVSVAIDNLSGRPVTLFYGAKIMDENGDWWETLPEDVVVSRIDDYTSGHISGKSLVKKTFLYGLAGGIVGAAVGATGGYNMAESIGKGAAIGGALGASNEIIYGSSGYSSSAGEISRDFAGRDMNARVIHPGVSEAGFLYFPSEIKRPRTLRLYFQAEKSASTSSESFSTIELTL